MKKRGSRVKNEIKAYQHVRYFFIVSWIYWSCEISCNISYRILANTFSCTFHMMGHMVVVRM